MLGVPKCSQFLRITMPYLRKPLISAVFATFTLVVTDYGVPLMVGGKTTTLPVLMYQEVIGLLNYDTGVAIGFVLLIPAIVAFSSMCSTRTRGKLVRVEALLHRPKRRARRAGLRAGRHRVGRHHLAAGLRSCSCRS